MCAVGVDETGRGIEKGNSCSIVYPFDSCVFLLL